MKPQVRSDLFTALLVTCTVLCGCRQQPPAAPPDYLGLMMENLFTSEPFAFPRGYCLQNERGDSVSVDSLFRHPALVFRFSETNCDLCIRTQMALLQEKMKSLPTRLIGLASYSNKRIYKLLKKQYGIDVPVYFIPSDESRFLLTEINESKNYPYLFVVDRELKGNYIFTPSNDRPEATGQYYDRAAERVNRENAAAIHFDPTIADLGNIRLQDTTAVRYYYTNHTPTPLIITDVKTACGCTVPEWEKKPLASGATACLTVYFKPLVEGYNVKKVFIYHNLSKDPLAVILKAQVVRE